MSDRDRSNPEVGQGHGSLAPDRVDPADYAERLRDAEPPCPNCAGRGTEQTRPDSFGNWDPCDACEGTGIEGGP